MKLIKFTSVLYMGLAMNTNIISAAYQGKITIQYYRHGETCANYVRDCLPEGADFDDCLKIPRNEINDADPFLTQNGLYETAVVGQILAKNKDTIPDIVLTSTMISGIESALYLFPGVSKVYPAPYIMNLHLTEDKPQSQELQVSLLKTYSKNPKEADRIDYSLIYDDIESGNFKENNCRENIDSISPRCYANFDNFLDWFTRRVVKSPVDDELIPENIRNKLHTNSDITVAIVGHGSQMKPQVLNLGSVSLPANAGYQSTFSYNNDKKKLLQRNGGTDEPWEIIEAANTGVDTCVNENNFAFLDRCVTRHQKPFNVIIPRYKQIQSDNIGKCPDGKTTITTGAYEYPEILKELDRQRDQQVPQQLKINVDIGTSKKMITEKEKEELIESFKDGNALLYHYEGDPNCICYDLITELNLIPALV